MDPASAQNLHRLVHDCLAKHLYDGAIFFADKLVTLSGYAPMEVFTLANAFFVHRQYRRCFQLLQTADYIDKDLRFRYLAARCLAEIKEWEECLELLGGLDIDDPDQLQFSAPPSEPGVQLDYISSVCLLRGIAYDALENFPRAVHWYKSALIKDPFNQEAFHKLIGCHKLTDKEERDLITTISARIPEQHSWLALLYRSSCKHYDHASVLAAEHALDCLEASIDICTTTTTTVNVNGGSNTGDNTNTTNNTTAINKDITTISTTATTTTAGPRTRRRSASTMKISPIAEEQSPQHHHDTTVTPLQTTNSNMMMMNDTTTTAQPLSLLQHNNNKGWGLTDNADVIACRATLLYYTGRYQQAFSLSSSALERDPYSTSILPIHIASAVQLCKKNELFMLGHRLIKAHPQHALSWYAAGCYYYVTKQFNAARQYFGKATTLDQSFAPAWISFALSFASLDETDQAMAGYRTAARLFPGLHEPLLGMGLEYSKMNNYPLAEQMLIAAHRKCPQDASIAHEMGTLCYKSGKHEEAVRWLVLSIYLATTSITMTALHDSSGNQDTNNNTLSSIATTTTIINSNNIPCAFDSLTTALSTLTTLLSSTTTSTIPSIEPTWVNLGHALRKLHHYDLAVESFSKALGMSPNASGTFAALGYTYHLMGDLQTAIEQYHKALGLKAEDSFVSMMLGIALEEYTNAMDGDGEGDVMSADGDGMMGD